MLKINKIVRTVAGLAMVAALCFAFYEVGQRVGRREAEVKIVEKQVEVIKYVEKKREDIQRLPNAERSQLLQNFRAGIL